VSGRGSSFASAGTFQKLPEPEPDRSKKLKEMEVCGNFAEMLEQTPVLSGLAPKKRTVAWTMYFDGLFVLKV